MGEVINMLLDGFRWYTDSLKGFVMEFFGFSVSMFDFLIAFLLLDLVIGLVFVIRPVRSSDSGVGSGTSERAPISEGDYLESATNVAIQNGSYDVDWYAERWAHYYERHGV